MPSIRPSSNGVIWRIRRSVLAPVQIARCASTDRRMRNFRAGNAAESATVFVEKNEKYRNYQWIKPDWWRKFHFLLNPPFNKKSYIFTLNNSFWRIWAQKLIFRGVLAPKPKKIWKGASQYRVGFAHMSFLRKPVYGFCSSWDMWVQTWAHFRNIFCHKKILFFNKFFSKIGRKWRENIFFNKFYFLFIFFQFKKNLLNKIF